MSENKINVFFCYSFIKSVFSRKEVMYLKMVNKTWLPRKSHNKYLYIHEVLFKGKHWLWKTLL